MMLVTQILNTTGSPAGGGFLYSPDALKPLLEIPGSWTQLLYEVYAHNDDSPIMMCMFAAIE